ncbi:MAG: histidine kinase dimerization/phosphoacceptor domain -containing protein [Methylovirgula sp.]
MKFVSFFRNLRRDRPWRGLAVGGVFIAVAGVLRWFLGGLSEGFGPMMFLPAILLAGLLGGIRVGVCVGIVSMLVAWVWFFPPYGTFTLGPRPAITMTIFILTACLELYVIRMLNVAINELSLATERSNTLFRELQHRVANNLQFIAALLQLEKKKLEQGCAGAHALESARNRLDLMALVHRRLQDPSAANLPVARYLEDLCGDLIKASDAHKVHLTVKVSTVKLDLESLMTVSLIIAELITNSLKHAFRDRQEGSIAVEFGSRKQIYTLTVADDGGGLPATFGQAKGTSLGQGILQSLASQLGGKISYQHGKGTIARLVFPA